MISFNYKIKKSILGFMTIILLLFLSACSDNKKNNTKKTAPKKVNSEKVSISLKNEGVINAFDSLSKSSGIKIKLTDRLETLNPKITIKLKHVSLYSAIRNIARVANLRFRVEDDQILVDTKN